MLVCVRVCACVRVCVCVRAHIRTSVCVYTLHACVYITMGYMCARINVYACFVWRVKLTPSNSHGDP